LPGRRNRIRRGHRLDSGRPLVPAAGSRIPSPTEAPSPLSGGNLADSLLSIATKSLRAPAEGAYHHCRSASRNASTMHPFENDGVRMTSIHEVARAAGVSISTVSYALSGKRPVSEKTRRRIEDAVHEL